MWIVVKVKRKELNIFKNNLAKEFGKETKIYYPKITYHKYFKNKLKKFEKLVLENYVFCHHKQFCKSNSINKLKFIKGLEYQLKGYAQDQIEIIRFIDHCKAFENKDGYLKPAFFKTMVTKKAKFLSGPFTNMIFEIIEKQKSQFKILIGNIVTTISEKNSYLYQPI